jgi:hypothetical protein
VLDVTKALATERQSNKRKREARLVMEGNITHILENSWEFISVIVLKGWSLIELVVLVAASNEPSPHLLLVPQIFHRYQVKVVEGLFATKWLYD